MTQMPQKLAKTTALRAMLASDELEFILEAHNGLSARIVEEAGFKGIWASGLALSAAFGVRDSNEASWTQVLETVEFMADASSIPILLDGDTGYGNFNNMRRLVRKLEQRGVAGVCIEDKVFPKTNSFIGGDRQPLADMDEFCGKIKAGKDSQADDDFSIVARVEALIAGWGLDEALRRAEAYQAAGADAILIHSKQSQADEVLAFAKAWDNRWPLVIVPTKYYGTPTEVFRRAKISLAIWANHTLRSAVTAMQATAAEIYRSQTLAGIEDQIAPVAEIFRLQGDEELRAAERRYIGQGASPANAVILAASRGDGLDMVTENQPKAMLEVAGKPLLRRQVDAFKKEQINDITVVAGYKAESIDVRGIDVVNNTDYAGTGELMSLACAKDALDNDTVVLYGDLIFRRYILRHLLSATGEVVAVVDSMHKGDANTPLRDPAWCSAADDHALFQQDVGLLHVGAEGAPERPHDGRWIGMMKASGDGLGWVKQALQAMAGEDSFAQAGVPELLNYLLAQGRPVKVMYVTGHWLDVNSVDDLRAAAEFAHGHKQA